MLPSRSDKESDTNKIVSPFANQEAVPPQKNDVSFSKIGIWVAAFLMLAGVGAGGAFFSQRYLNDPYRTMESFPVTKYLENYRSLAGSKFKAEIHVEADLGWKENVGKLMLFSITGDSRPVAILVPASIAKDV